MAVWELHTQLFMRNWKCRRFARSLSERCSEKIRKKDIVMTAGRWSSWTIQILQFLILWWPAMKAGSTAMTQRPRDSVPSGSTLAHPDPRRPDRANHPTNLWRSLFFFTALALSICTGFPLDRQSTRNTMFKGVQEEIRRKRPALFKSSQWHFHQDNAPVHNSILVTDYLTKMGIKTVPNPPYSPYLAPCDFLLFPKLKEKLRGNAPVHRLSEQDGQDSSSPSVMRQLRRWKRLWRRSLTRSHKRTSMGYSRSCWNGTTSCITVGGDFFEGD